MKLIHTADWHLGNQMHDINRTEEYRHFFKWLKEKIIQEKAEVLVISGDVFDVANPSVEARKLYFDFLSVLDETECSNIVIIGGNHDSGNLLDAPKQILKKFLEKIFKDKDSVAKYIFWRKLFLENFLGVKILHISVTNF